MWMWNFASCLGKILQFWCCKQLLKNGSMSKNSNVQAVFLFQEDVELINDISYSVCPSTSKIGKNVKVHTVVLEDWCSGHWRPLWGSFSNFLISLVYNISIPSKMPYTFNVTKEMSYVNLVLQHQIQASNLKKFYDNFGLCYFYLCKILSKNFINSSLKLHKIKKIAIIMLPFGRTD